MLLKTRGIPVQLDSPIIGKITRDSLKPAPDHILILESESPDKYQESFKAILTKTAFNGTKNSHPLVHSIRTTDHLKDGDIVSINSDGVVNTLYRVNAKDNHFLVTERCNCNCLMCPQPPKDRDDILYLFNIYKQVVPLIPKDCVQIGITGGEPTLLGNLLFELLKLIKMNLPFTEVHCLTNGRNFQSSEFASKLGEMTYERLM